MLGGYANKIAQIDLTSGAVKYEEVNEELAQRAEVKSIIISTDFPAGLPPVSG